MVGSVLEGEHRKRLHEAESSKHLMGEMMKREKVKGFAEVIISRNLGDGISYLLVIRDSMNGMIFKTIFLIFLSFFLLFVEIVLHVNGDVSYIHLHEILAFFFLLKFTTLSPEQMN